MAGSQTPVNFLPPRSAYTPQAPLLFSDTIQNNILLAAGRTL